MRTSWNLLPRIGEDQPVASNVSEPAPARIRGVRGWERFLFLGMVLVWLFWLAGQIARDRSWLLGLCLDFPSPVLASFYAGLVLLMGWRRHHRLALIAATLGLAPLGMIVWVENQWVRPTLNQKGKVGKTFRLVHWNIGYGAQGEEEAKRELAQCGADVLVVSEPTVPVVFHFAKVLGPSYKYAPYSGSVHLIARGELTDRLTLADDHGLKVHIPGASLPPPMDEYIDRM